MGYKISVVDGRVHEIFNDQSLEVPNDVIEISDEMFLQIRGATSFADYIYQDGQAVYSPIPKSPDQIRRELTAALDGHIDSVAKAKGYDSRITCTMRAGYVNPWQVECIAFGQWMDQCYVIGLTAMAEVEAGTRPVPTAEELLALMPAMVWPV